MTSDNINAALFLVLIAFGLFGAFELARHGVLFLTSLYRRRRK